MSVGAQWYNKAWEQFMKHGLGDLSDAGVVVKAMLLKSTYNFDPAAHAFVSDISAYEVVGTTGYTGGFAGSGRKTLANKFVARQISTPYDVIFGADPLAWTSLLVSPAQLGGVAVWFPVTSDADSPLLLFDDTGYPYTTTGINFTHGFNVFGAGKLSY